MTIEELEQISIKIAEFKILMLENDGITPKKRIKAIEFAFVNVLNKLFNSNHKGICCTSKILPTFIRAEAQIAKFKEEINKAASPYLLVKSINEKGETQYKHVLKND